jgi:hypothetical protein
MFNQAFLGMVSLVGSLKLGQYTTTPSSYDWEPPTPFVPYWRKRSPGGGTIALPGDFLPPEVPGGWPTPPWPIPTPPAPPQQRYWGGGIWDPGYGPPPPPPPPPPRPPVPTHPRVQYPWPEQPGLSPPPPPTPTPFRPRNIPEGAYRPVAYTMGVPLTLGLGTRALGGRW